MKNKIKPDDRQCSICGTKKMKRFYVEKKLCGTCYSKELYKSDPKRRETARRVAKEWYYKNKEKQIESNRLWRKNNPEKFLLSMITSHYKKLPKDLQKIFQQKTGLVSKKMLGGNDRGGL